MGSGLITEIGGEFIDTIHEDMLTMATEFGLELIDVESPSEQALPILYRVPLPHLITYRWLPISTKLA